MVFILDEKEFKIYVESDDFVADLKCQIQMVYGGILCEEQELSYNGAILEDTDMIKLYGIRDISVSSTLEIRKKTIYNNITEVNRNLDLVAEPIIHNYDITATVKNN